jgi:hypothetical protein
MDGGAVIKLYELEVSIAMRNNKLRSLFCSAWISRNFNKKQKI